jgi:hypothetical protein
MKRALAALAILGLGSVMAMPAQAAGPTVYGSAQLKYTVTATAALSLATNYVPATGSQSAAAASILPSAALSCTAGVAEGGLATLSFGNVTPPAGATSTGCYYQNAISVGISSNDALGVTLTEGIDVASAGVVVCAFPLNAAPAALPAASGAAGNPAAQAAGTCPTVNAVVGQKLAAVAGFVAPGGFGAAGAPAGVTTDVNAQGTLFTAPGGFTVFTTGAPLGYAGYKFMGQDIQLNVDGTAASGAATKVVVFALVAS